MLRFPIALIVAWTPDLGYFIAKCPLLAIRSSIVTSRMSFKFKDFSVVVAMHRNTSCTDIVCSHSPQNEEDPSPTYTLELPEKHGFFDHVSFT